MESGFSMFTLMLEEIRDKSNIIRGQEEHFFRTKTSPLLIFSAVPSLKIGSLLRVWNTRVFLYAQIISMDIA